MEDDPVNPLGAYGRSKAEGEALIRDALPEHVILRTSWVCGPYGTNFVKTMMRLGGERPEMRVVADQRGCPTVAGRSRPAPSWRYAPPSRRARPASAPITWPTPGATTWYDIRGGDIRGLAARGDGCPQVVPITTAEYPTQGGAAGQFACSIAAGCARTFGVTLRPWRTRSTNA